MFPRRRGERGHNWKSTKKIKVENFKYLTKDINFHNLRSWVNSKEISPVISTWRHIIVKLLKTEDKEKTLKAAKEEWHLTYRGKAIQMTVNFTSEIMQAGKKWHIFQYWKKRNYQPRILYPAKISFRNEGEIKIFSDEGKVIEFVISRHTLKE